MEARPRNVTLLALTMGVFLVTLNVTVVTVALPDIQRSLHARPDELEWVIDAYNLVGASLLLSAGFFADRFGRKRALCAGYSVFAGGALLCAFAPTAGWLIAFRVLQAVGGTALTPTSLAIVANLYRDPLERARAIGIWGVASGLGLGAGPIVGGAVSDWMGWRAVFAVNAVAGLVALVIAIRVVPRSRSDVARGLDVRGQVLAVVLLASLTYALIEAPRYGWGSPRIVLLLAADVVLAIVFAVVELRVREPLIDLRVFRDRQFSGAIFITVAVFFAYSGFVYFTALYLQQVRGMSALLAGVVMLPGALPVLALGPISGRLVATRGARGVLVRGDARARPRDGAPGPARPRRAAVADPRPRPPGRHRLRPDQRAGEHGGRGDAPAPAGRRRRRDCLKRAQRRPGARDRGARLGRERPPPRAAGPRALRGRLHERHPPGLRGRCRRRARRRRGRALDAARRASRHAAAARDRERDDQRPR